MSVARVCARVLLNWLHFAALGQPLFSSLTHLSAIYSILVEQEEGSYSFRISNISWLFRFAAKKKDSNHHGCCCIRRLFIVAFLNLLAFSWASLWLSCTSSSFPGVFVTANNCLSLLCGNNISSSGRKFVLKENKFLSKSNFTRALSPGHSVKLLWSCVQDVAKSSAVRRKRFV